MKYFPVFVFWPRFASARPFRRRRRTESSPSTFQNAASARNMKRESPTTIISMFCGIKRDGCIMRSGRRGHGKEREIITSFFPEARTEAAHGRLRLHWQVPRSAQPAVSTPVGSSRCCPGPGGCMCFGIRRSVAAGPTRYFAEFFPMTGAKPGVRPTSPRRHARQMRKRSRSLFRS